MFDGKAFLLGEGFSRGGSLYSIIFKLWYKRYKSYLKVFQRCVSAFPLVFEKRLFQIGSNLKIYFFKLVRRNGNSQIFRRGPPKNHLGFTHGFQNTHIQKI